MYIKDQRAVACVHTAEVDSITALKSQLVLMMYDSCMNQIDSFVRHSVAQICTRFYATLMNKGWCRVMCGQKLQYTRKELTAADLKL